MKNRVLLFIIALAFFGKINAQEINDYIYKEYDGYTLTFIVTKATDPYEVSVACEKEPEFETQLAIPEYITDDNGIEYIVTSVCDGGFRELYNFVGNLNIPNTIKKIDDNAFLDCENLNGELIIGGNISTLGASSFSGCSFSSVKITSTKLRRIGSNAFRDCKKINKVEITSPITTIGNYAFYNCKIKDLKLPSSVRTIDEYAFYGTQLTKMEFPSKTETIEAHAFESNTLLEEVIIPNTVTYIGRRAFYRNKNLVTVRCYAVDVPTLDEDGLGVYTGLSSNIINDNLTIYVPAASLPDYEATDYWAGYESYDDKDRIVGMPTFVQDGEWKDANNWKPQEIPSSNADVSINADAIINANDIAQINSYGVYGGSITIHDGGQLIHTKGYGEVTLKKSINAYVVGEDSYLTSGWYTISSPFGEIPVTALLKNNYELYRYNESIYEWENVKNPENNFTTLEAGRGYIYANGNTTELSIKGTPNVENKTQTLTAQGEYLTGFNLIGNPFMHNIYKGSGAAIYSPNLATGYYTLTNEGAWNAKTDNTPIKPNQGILIKTTTAGKLNINKTPAKSVTKSLNNGLVSIKVSNNKYEDNAYVTFNGGIGLDKIDHRNSQIPMIYIPLDNVNYAIAVMDEDVTEIPLNFEATTMGEYTISISAKECGYNEITLIDRKLNISTNMLMEDYTFLGTTNDHPERFIVKLSKKTPEAHIYTNDQNIIINNIKGRGHVQVFDAMGRVVADYNADTHCQLSTETMAKGVYIVRLFDDNGNKIQKIIVQ